MFEPRELPLTWIDEQAPFIPWTAFIYVGVYPLLLFIPVLMNNAQMLCRMMVTALIMAVICFGIFIVFPTTYSIRPEVVSLKFGAFWSWAFGVMHSADSPNNCLPSLHVSTAIGMVLVFWRERPKLFWFFVPVSIVVSLVTLTTKQHYFWDILAGAGVALVSYAIAYVKYPLKK